MEYRISFLCLLLPCADKLSVGYNQGNIAERILFVEVFGLSQLEERKKMVFPSFSPDSLPSPKLTFCHMSPSENLLVLKLWEIRFLKVCVDRNFFFR